MMRLLVVFVIVAVPWLNAQQIIGPDKMIGPVKMISGAAGAGHTFTNVQRAANGTCSTASATCSDPVSSTGAGHAITIGVGYSDNSAQRTISSITAGACNVAWVIPAATAAWESTTSGSGVAMAYCPNSTSGQTTIAVTMSAAPNVSWTVIVWEDSYTGAGNPTQDDAQATGRSTANTAQTGLTPVLTGTSELIHQIVGASGGNVSNVTIYANIVTGGSSGGAELLNTSTTTPPVWTMSLSEAVAVAELALK